MNLIFLVATAITLFLLTLAYSKSAFDKNGKPTCNNYVLNTYTYVSIMVTLTGLLSYLVKNNFDPTYFRNFGWMPFLLVLFISLGSLIGIYVLPKDQQVAKYALTAVFCAVSAFLIGIQWLIMNYSDQLMVSVLLLTLFLFAIVSIIATKFKQYISDKFMLLTSIIVLIFFMIQLLVLFFTNPSNKTIQKFAIAGIGACLLLLLVKTKMLLVAAQNCVKNGGPDYPREGVSIFIYLKDIFLDILRLKRK